MSVWKKKGDGKTNFTQLAPLLTLTSSPPPAASQPQASVPPAALPDARGVVQPSQSPFATPPTPPTNHHATALGALLCPDTLRPFDLEIVSSSSATVTSPPPPPPESHHSPPPTTSPPASPSDGSSHSHSYSLTHTHARTHAHTHTRFFNAPPSPAPERAHPPRWCRVELMNTLCARWC